jgi:hypothetical protein
VKGGHSCCLRDLHVSCCQVDTLQGYFILIRISATPSDMGEACSLLSFRRSVVSSVHMRLLVMFSYDYLVVEINDIKND